MNLLVAAPSIHSAAKVERLSSWRIFVKFSGTHPLK
jgi:hypothetical protein